MRRVYHYALIGLGWVFVAVGIVGVILPGIPGTVFLIMAAAIFARTSPRFEHWLLTHPKLGPPVTTWRRTGSIAPAIKVIAIGSMAASFVLIWFTAPPVAILASGLCLAGSAVFVGSRPNA